ncbi:hypothetical protein WJX75_000556 [Coccomyxa subellipsoidea]|uniref:NADH dehydrogenase [ubiquinone] 1 beta subcomplex subunit 11, mitochondrial n=1 Tax=Coccomyxa subellipsoidea TaxID=248742 RepID=A0ABR2YZI6_9CHLO
MSFLRRLAPSALRNLRPRAADSHAKETLFAPGKNTPGGYLFNETPPPPGQKRHLESWELPWYFTLVAATVMLTVGLSAKPDTNITSWARKEAAKELKEEGKL